jgi:NitT/TauT family transport system substrate-binding protein
MADIVRIAATGAGISYFPEFVARELGFYADEGLYVQVEVIGNGPGVPVAVATGTADIGFGGSWLPVMYRGRLSSFYPFAQVCIRSPASLMARMPQPDFQWSDLIGKSVLIPCGSPGASLLINHTLRQEGIDPGRVAFIQDFLAEEAGPLFTGGMADYYVGMPPSTDLMIARGAAYEVLDLAGLGEYPWSIFYARKPFLDREDNVAGRFAKATQRGLTWCLTHDPAEATAVIEKHFGKLDPSLVIASARSIKARGLWHPSVRVTEPAMMHWQELIAAGRYIEAPLPYAEAIDTRAAEWATAELAKEAAAATV